MPKGSWSGTEQTVLFLKPERHDYSQHGSCEVNTDGCGKLDSNPRGFD